MKLTRYQPRRLQHPLQWISWKFLHKPPTPPLLSEPPPRASASRSLFLRHLDCGSCNGCELALHALETPFYDLPGYGVHVVASPRHADALLMTGPLTYNLKDAALATLRELSQPRVIAVGDCAIDGGPFKDAYGVLPVEERPQELEDAVIARIPGCPPEPRAILNALMTLRLQPIVLEDDAGDPKEPPE